MSVARLRFVLYISGNFENFRQCVAELTAFSDIAPGIPYGKGGIFVFSGIDTLWVLLGAALVFFMQAGFAMVETGFTRAKNAGNIIMKNLMDFAIGTPL